MSPVFFFAYPVVGLVGLLVGLRLRVVLRARSVRLSVPAGAAPCVEARQLELSPPFRSGVGTSWTYRRDGQLPPLTAAGQERWARQALRPGAGGLVDVAPCECPLRPGPGRA